MKRIRLCGRCGNPWARHVPRCPGCGLQSPAPAQLLVAAFVAVALVYLWGAP